MLRFYTAGESHGKGLVGFLEGLPAGLEIDRGFIDRQLRRRQLGYGRGGRMAIESDRVEVLAGVRHGRTLGSPVAFLVENKDWANWTAAMSPDPVAGASDDDLRRVTRPRPGHADLAGAVKYQTHDVRDVLERASARETAARVAGGAFCRTLTACFGVEVASHVLAIGAARVATGFESLPLAAILAIDQDDPAGLRVADAEAARRMAALIDGAGRDGDTLGGVVEVVAGGVPPGLGSHVQWDRRLDGRIAQAMMSIPSAKAVEVGAGVEGAHNPGSLVHDAISYDAAACRFTRATNRAGGVEGGVSNGEELRVRVHLKPIPTLRRPLASVDVEGKQPFDAAVERGDVCAVPAAGVVAEAMLGVVLAEAFVEKFGGDSLAEMRRNFDGYMELVRGF
ncbi:MAG: chorismate synthase [Acidobacteriota bacterium]|jgi:chorismate synthase|nr:chorismate synthase [Acidobacteriota bacterium]